MFRKESPCTCNDDRHLCTRIIDTGKGSEDEADTSNGDRIQIQQETADGNAEKYAFPKDGEKAGGIAYMNGLDWSFVGSRKKAFNWKRRCRKLAGGRLETADRAQRRARLQAMFLWVFHREWEREGAKLYLCNGLHDFELFHHSERRKMEDIFTLDAINLPLSLILLDTGTCTSRDILVTPV